MVRYRLLFLTSAPIVLTLLALVGITVYWSTHYTWQNALVNVEEKLSVAQNSTEILQAKQAQSIQSIGDHYHLRRLWESGDLETLNYWLAQQRQEHGLDYLRWVNQYQDLPVSDIANKSTFLTVLDKEQLTQLDPTLARRAQVELRDKTGIETRGLVSRTIFPVRIDDITLGYLDGGILLNNSTQLVDKIRSLIYPKPSPLQPKKGTVTIFLDDIRVSTNVPLSSESQQGRAIGTRVSEEVKNIVLGKGQNFIDRAYVYDDWYITAYQPLRDKEGAVVGMLYTGYLIWPLIKVYITNLGEIGLTIATLLIISGMMVYRGSRDLFDPVERIHTVVKAVQKGHSRRIGMLGLHKEHELEQLASQFDIMLDLLEKRNQEIRKAADELEEKVQSRTVKLKEQTEALEHHIVLLNQTRDKLVVSEKLAALGQLTAGIAHEINNPTAVILGNVELLKFELGEEATHVDDELTAIMAQIDRIRTITRSLLQYSRQGGIQDEITWQHINPIIEESLTLVKTAVKNQNIEIQTDFKAKTIIEMNRHQLLQILVNIEMNGIHAMDGEGTLLITTQDWVEGNQTKGVLVEIHDQGCGIAPESLKRIFDPFYTTKREGTGLGLSVTQSLLEQSGGDIKVSSTEGEGSTFTLMLPSKVGQIEAQLITTGT
ncbi:cache domain-containing protein [Vibrio sp. SCSIO 43136]|uniref:sensor histidine kinase n=1 Tax=Vibrio sp. SCSIO 43136 TaxID=2819101 RepID=UPI00207582B5|nr:cache domain-containing protein [Vibrio sp. SCSIO 43136]